MQTNIHIGFEIKRKVEERKMRIVDFAKAMHCNRANVYSLFQRKTIDVSLLILISEVLKYDFIQLYFKSTKNDKFPQKYAIVLETEGSVLEMLKQKEEIHIIKYWKIAP